MESDPINLIIRRPDDFHAHFRDGAAVTSVVGATARQFARAIAMPNLKPAVTTVEATGETVSEAKWRALQELERLEPTLDKSAVRFQVLEEGHRGLLGVGSSPARVVATAVSPRAGSQPADAHAVRDAGLARHHQIPRE